MYLIDGNNVIGQRVGWHRDKPGSRRRLMQELARLARVKKIRVTVVFDGAPDPQFPDGSSCRGVKIFYSRRGSDADMRIVEMVESERNKKNLVVVTSDGKLASLVRANGVRVIRSGEFRQMLDDVINAAHDEETERADEMFCEKENEVDDWMRYFGVNKSEED
jgi:predicted RNA-binding protein with PIN domain